MDVDAACAYAEKHELHALLIEHEGAMLLERYGARHGAGVPHALYSGTKGFWGIAALAAGREGILDLDAPVTDALPEFASDARKRITPRMLLQMTAGYGFGGLGSSVPTDDQALTVSLKTPPGTAFTYGGIPLQVFGVYFARKLAPRGQSPHEYLRFAVLDPAAVEVSRWRALRDGTHPLPTGAFLTAPQWLAYGRHVLRNHERYAQAFTGSAQNPGYGLGWWLASIAGERVFYASGSGGQGLSIVPARNLVAVHFGKSGSYKHEALLKRLLA